MRFGKLALAAAFAAAFGAAVALTASALLGGFLLEVTDISSRYQLAQLTPAGAGSALTPSLLDVDSAVGWRVGGASGGGGLVYVPAAAPAPEGGAAVRQSFTDMAPGETKSVGALFEPIASSESGNGFAAGGATVTITNEGGGSYVLQIVAQQNGVKSVLASNSFSLTPAELSEIESGGEVTAGGSNRPQDNPLNAVQMTFTFVEGGSVIIADIARLTA